VGGVRERKGGRVLVEEGRVNQRKGRVLVNKGERREG
jgi:hypothetical protein